MRWVYQWSSSVGHHWDTRIVTTTTIVTIITAAAGSPIGELAHQELLEKVVSAVQQGDLVCSGCQGEWLLGPVTPTIAIVAATRVATLVKVVLVVEQLGTLGDAGHQEWCAGGHGGERLATEGRHW